MNTVEIIISENDSEGNLHEFTAGGNYTSVKYEGHNYGGSSPCITQLEINQAITHMKQTIIGIGDKPKIIDQRKKATLLNWVK